MLKQRFVVLLGELQVSYHTAVHTAGAQHDRNSRREQKVETCEGFIK